MTVQHRVLLFAALRDRAKAESVSVELEPGATVAILLERLRTQHPALGDLLSQCRVAVAQTFAGPGRVIEPGEEIALVPPVSGGHDGRPRIALRRDALSLADVLAHVEHDGAGGVATFTGNVRRASRGRTIEHLDYEAYEPMALRVMTEIADSIEARIEGTRVSIHHRLGRLQVGETAVVIAASAPHRAEAFEACRAAIEALKQDVPIWKKEVATDGASWIGQGP